MSFMRVALLILQSNLDRDARNMRQVRPAERLSGLGEISPDRQNLGLAHREIDVERIDLDDGCERGRSRSADEIADIDLMIGDDAVKGGHYPRVAEVDVCGIDVGLNNSDRSLVLLDDEFLVLRLLQGNRLLLCQCLVAVQIDLRLSEHRLVFRQLRFGLIERRLINVALDLEEQRSLRHGGAILIIDGLQVALDSRDEISGSVWRGVA